MAKNKDMTLIVRAILDTDITPKLEEMEKSFKDIENKLKKVGNGAKDFPKNIGEEAEKTKKKLKDLANSISKFSLGTSVALAGFGAMAYKSFTTFESGALKVKTISDESLKSIKKNALDLSKKYGVATAQILEANYQMVSSMGDIKDSAKVMSKAVELSVAGFTSVDNAMNGLVSVINGYKMSIDDVTKVSDILMTIQNKGITTVGELQASLSQVIPTATAVGVSFEDLATAITTLTSNKISTAETTTYLNTMLAELGTNGTKIGKLFTELSGTTFTNFIKQGHSLFDALRIIENHAKKTNKSMLDLFSSINGSRGALNLLGDNTKKVNETLDAVNKSAGTTTKAFNKMSEGGEFAFNRLKETLKSVQIQIGGALAPKINELVESLNKIDFEQVFSESNVNSIVNVGTSIFTVTTAVWGLNKAVNTFIKTKESIMYIVAGLKMLSSAAATSIASVGALGTAIYKQYNDFSKNGGLAGYGSVIDKKTRKMDNEEQIAYLEKEIKLHKEKLEILQKHNKNKKRMSKELIDEQNRLDLLNKRYEKQLKIKEEIANAKNNLPIIPTEKIEQNKTDDSIIKAFNKELAEKQAIENANQTMIALKERLKNIITFNELVDMSDIDSLQSQFNFLSGELRKAIEMGAENGGTILTEKIKSEMDNIKDKLNNVKINLVMSEYNKNSKSIAQTSGTNSNAQLGNLRTTIKNLENINTQRAKTKATELKAKEKEIINFQKIAKKEEDARNRNIKSMETFASSINSIASSLQSIGANSGSKGMQGAGQLLSGGMQIFDMLGGSGGAAAGASGAASAGGAAAASGAAASGGAMAAMGAAMPYVAAGLMAIQTVQQLGATFGWDGKKKKAKIKAENERQKQLYQKQVGAMEKLTQALQNNTERIKNFTDKMLIDMAAHPTVSRIGTGRVNYDLARDTINNNKHFEDISAIEAYTVSYRKWFKKKHATAYRAVQIGEKKILEYLGFKKKELDDFNFDEIEALDNQIDIITHQKFKQITGRRLTESNVEEWKKQVHEFAFQMRYIKEESNKIFEGATLENFVGVNYREEKILIKEYSEMFEQMGVNVKDHMSTIKELAKNNQVLISSMQDVRAGVINTVLSEKEGGFLRASKSYFEKIFKNAASVVYDVSFSEIDSYMTKQFEKISYKLVDIKRSGKMDFTHLFDGFDFNKLNQANNLELSMKKQIDDLKQTLYQSGLDMEIINKILPISSFNERIDNIEQALSSAMQRGLETTKYYDFTKELGKSLYDSTKNALVKAFSESKLYQGMIEKFINLDDYKKKLEKAGSMKDAFKMSQNILKDFGFKLESLGLGGFDAINNVNNQDRKLGNAYYQDKQQSIKIEVINNFYAEVYGVDDLNTRIVKGTQAGIKEYLARPNASR